MFECESKYYKAIEVIAEGRLFYHVVEDDQIATTLLNFINEQDLHGEINFYPLNRVVPKPKRSVNDQVFIYFFFYYLLYFFLGSASNA